MSNTSAKVQQKNGKCKLRFTVFRRLWLFYSEDCGRFVPKIMTILCKSVQKSRIFSVFQLKVSRLFMYFCRNTSNTTGNTLCSTCVVGHFILPYILSHPLCPLSSHLRFPASPFQGIVFRFRKGIAIHLSAKRHILLFQ